MGRLFEIFGKDSGIKRSDIEKFLIENGIEESLNTEYKSFKKVDVLDNEKIEDLILKPIIAFLNGIEKTSSLLVFGVMTKEFKPAYVEPIKKDLLTEEKLRNIITSNIASIPTYKAFPIFKILQIECPPGNESIFLLEINPFEDVLYYSKISESSYIRRGSESTKLSLNEIINLIQSKKYSKVFLGLQNVGIEKIEEGSRIRIKIKTQLDNQGSIPATNVTAVIGIKKSENSNVEIKTILENISHVNPHNFKTFIIRTAKAGKDQPIYPTLTQVDENIEFIFDSEAEIILNSEIYDTEGKSNQTFIINKDGIKEIGSQHTTYLR